jgi:antitoxin component YwqK of YwqJK toxin-antitoxin module
MKKNIIIVVLLILIPVVYFQHDRIARLIGLIESVDMKVLMKRDGFHYKKHTDIPFTGKVTGDEQGSFKDGKEDGPWVRYHDNGKLESKGTYKNGKKNGPWVKYHGDGQLSSKGTFKDGKMDGPWVTYHKNGQLEYKGTFKDGVKVK